MVSPVVESGVKFAEFASVIVLRVVQHFDGVCIKAKNKHSSLYLDQIGYVHGQFFNFCIVICFKVAQCLLVIIRNEIDSHTFLTECATTPNTGIKERNSFPFDIIDSYRRT